jgi:hypothetical protein
MANRAGRSGSMHHRLIMRRPGASAVCGSRGPDPTAKRPPAPDLPERLAGRRSAGSLGSGSQPAQDEDMVKFGDKLKDLRKQAQGRVAENRDKIHDAVDVVSTTVDQKTGGKHTAKIAKFGEQAGAAVDRFSESDDEAGGKPKPADG